MLNTLVENSQECTELDGAESVGYKVAQKGLNNNFA